MGKSDLDLGFKLDTLPQVDKPNAPVRHGQDVPGVRVPVEDRAEEELEALQIQQHLQRGAQLPRRAAARQDPAPPLAPQPHLREHPQELHEAPGADDGRGQAEGPVGDALPCRLRHGARLAAGALSETGAGAAVGPVTALARCLEAEHTWHMPLADIHTQGLEPCHEDGINLRARYIVHRQHPAAGQLRDGGGNHDTAPELGRCSDGLMQRLEVVSFPRIVELLLKLLADPLEYWQGYVGCLAETGKGLEAVEVSAQGRCGFQELDLDDHRAAPPRGQVGLSEAR
mmetsp:Transcript_35968/g.102715  ORF Transcript_35968/g.102715 Transcript_35968/m.102715 type:complete len:285 (+) Transcript_35968:426-1280(+)